MSQQYDRTNSGALFKNQNRQSDRSPEYGGTINVEGKEYYLNGWVKEGRNGKFFSLSLKPKEEQKPSQQRKAPPSDDGFDTSQEIPF